MKTIHVVGLIGRSRRSEAGFSHYHMLNWISINEDSGLRRIRFGITLRIRIITVNTGE